jgi:hypothetical protein
LRNLNLQGNPISEIDSLAKKVSSRDRHAFQWHVFAIPE